MEMNPYLNFKGDCEAALTFYAECLAGKLGELFRYGGTPMADHAPAGWENKVMHGSVTIAGQTVMGADVPPERYEKPAGFSLSIQIKDVAQAEQIFNRLAAGGTVMMPLEKTFWAQRFGALVDRFGIPWMINCE